MFLDKGLALIKSFEGCQLKAYQDQGGRWTIGYGSTGLGIEVGVEWNLQEAEDRLSQDVTNLCDKVLSFVTVPLTDNQLAALVSFSYNLGIFNLQRSGLLKKLNRGDYKGAADQFLLWDKIGVYVSKGLQNRRAKEREVFLSK